MKRSMVAEVLREHEADMFYLEETKLVDPPILYKEEINLKRNFALIFKYE